jgi:hypothetical protein
MLTDSDDDSVGGSSGFHAGGTQALPTRCARTEAAPSSKLANCERDRAIRVASRAAGPDYSKLSPGFNIDHRVFSKDVDFLGRPDIFDIIDAIGTIPRIGTTRLCASQGPPNLGWNAQTSWRACTGE